MGRMEELQAQKYGLTGELWRRIKDEIAQLSPSIENIIDNTKDTNDIFRAAGTHKAFKYFLELPQQIDEDIVREFEKIEKEKQNKEE